MAKKKRAVLVSVVGYRLLRNLCTPDKPGDKTYEELVQKLTVLYKPSSSTPDSGSRENQLLRSSLSSGVLILRRDAGANATRSASVRYWDDATQKRLLAEPVLTYKKATEIALSMKRAVKNVREFK